MQRKYYLNGHFEDETTTDYMGQIMTASKFTPENNHVDKITDVTLPIFQSYGMESEEIAQERGWIAYTIPQERGINQDQQQQQYQQQQDRQQQNGPQKHKRKAQTWAEPKCRNSRHVWRVQHCEKAQG